MVSLDPWAYVAGAALVLTLPLHWLLAAAAAAAFHELCHMAAILALGGRVLHIHIGVLGAAMETELEGKNRELLAALAGPAGSLLLACLFRSIPHIAICGAIQGLFNLLPLYPLDGGRALRRSLEGAMPERAERNVEGILAVLLVPVLFRWIGFFALILAIRVLIGKIPCKPRKIGVQ